MRNILFILLIIFFKCSYVQAQINSNILNIHEISIKENVLLNDTSSHHVLEIPFLGFDISINSAPGLKKFLTTQGNYLSINFNDYNNFDNNAHHLFDVHNQLLGYSFKHLNNIYSFGLSHRLFSEFSLSSELVSLIIDGNAQYLNQKLIMDNQNYGYILNYLSFDFGYYNQINNQLSLGAKFKFIKGINSFGMELKNSSFLVSDNLNTSQNPFEIELDAETSYFINTNNSLFSNLGCAIDLCLDYDYTDRISFYTQAYDIGFVIWNEDHYDSDGILNFDGLDFSLDQLLDTEYNIFQDSILDIFELKNQSASKFRVLPFMINLGASYSLYDSSQINLNYSIKKNLHSFIHTTKLSYMYHLEKYKFSIIPSYSINKYDYTNISILLNKRWKNHFYTNVYCNNIIDFLFINSGGGDIGLGCEVYLLF